MQSLDAKDNSNFKTLDLILKKLCLEFPVAEIARKTGYKEGTISPYINKKVKPSTKFLQSIMDAYGINSKDLEENPTIINKALDPKEKYIKAPDGKFYKAKTNELVPFYNVDFAAGNQLVLVDNNQVQPDYYMDVPEFAGCTAFRAYSDSMERLIKSGNILFGTKVEEWNIHLEYGQIYGIICTDGRRYLKYIKKWTTNPSEYFLLKSENIDYDDFEIPKNAIRSIWLIHGWLNRRT